MCTEIRMLDTLKRPSLLILAISTAATWFVGLVSPHSWSAACVAISWIAFGLYVLYRLIRNRQLWIAALPVFFVLAIGIGISLPVGVLNDLLQPANELITRWNLPLSAGKYGHVFCFAMLTLFALAIRRKLTVTPRELVLFIFLLAVATEGFQLFVAGRTTKAFDLVLDLAGALIGFGIFLIYKRLYPNRLGSLQINADRSVEA